METSYCIDSPVGRLELRASEQAVTAIRFCGATHVVESAEPTPLLLLAARELVAYFAGTRREFTIPLAPAGTPFQQAVWSALRAIPYGETRTYKQIAEQIGRPLACRAVGMANNRNPLPIVIPCHRVVGSNGKMVGYAGGVDVKVRLLGIEQCSLV